MLSLIQITEYNALISSALAANGAIHAELIRLQDLPFSEANAADVRRIGKRVRQLASFGAFINSQVANGAPWSAAWMPADIHALLADPLAD